MSLVAAQSADGDLYVAQNVFFTVIAVSMIVSAVRVVTTSNIVHAALWLVVVLAGVAAQFILLGSEFVAVTQVLVYIGAVVVLFLFGVMLTRASLGDDESVGDEKRGMAAAVGVLLFAVMAVALIHSFEDEPLGYRSTPVGKHRVGRHFLAIHRGVLKRSPCCCWQR